LAIGYTTLQAVTNGDQAENLTNMHNAKATRMWATAQRDGRPAKHRWRLLFNAAKFG